MYIRNYILKPIRIILSSGGRVIHHVETVSNPASLSGVLILKAWHNFVGNKIGRAKHSRSANFRDVIGQFCAGSTYVVKTRDGRERRPA